MLSAADRLAKSKKQQMAAGAALSAKRSDRPTLSLVGASKEMVNSMSEQELKEMAGTKRKNRSEKVRQND